MTSALSLGGEADTGSAGGFHFRGDADAAVPCMAARSGDGFGSI
jgi:hypothetical protein